LPLEQQADILRNHSKFHVVLSSIGFGGIMYYLGQNSVKAIYKFEELQKSEMESNSKLSNSNEPEPVIKEKKNKVHHENTDIYFKKLAEARKADSSAGSTFFNTGFLEKAKDQATYFYVKNFTTKSDTSISDEQNFKNYKNDKIKQEIYDRAPERVLLYGNPNWEYNIFPGSIFWFTSLGILSMGITQLRITKTFSRLNNLKSTLTTKQFNQNKSTNNFYHLFKSSYPEMLKFTKEKGTQGFASDLALRSLYDCLSHKSSIHFLGNLLLMFGAVYYTEIYLCHYKNRYLSKNESSAKNISCLSSVLLGGMVFKIFCKEVVCVTGLHVLALPFLISHFLLNRQYLGDHGKNGSHGDKNGGPDEQIYDIGLDKIGFDRKLSSVELTGLISTFVILNIAFSRHLAISTLNKSFTTAGQQQVYTLTKMLGRLFPIPFCVAGSLAFKKGQESLISGRLELENPDIMTTKENDEQDSKETEAENK